MGVHWKGDPTLMTQQPRTTNPELNALLQVATILGRPASLSEKATDVLTTVIETVDAELGVLRVPDESAERLELLAWIDQGVVSTPEPLDVLSPGMTSVCFTQGEMINIDDYPSHPEAVQSLVGVGIKSAIYLPLTFEERKLGVMALSSRTRAHFTDARVRFLIAVTREMGVLMDNARLHETLRKQAEELERSNRELEQFAYVASHDLQEPLRMVSSYVQLLARRYEGQLDKDADEFIEFAVDGAHRMQTLINDILTYSRVTTQAQPLDKVSCRERLEEAKRSLTASIEESLAEVTSDPLPEVMADGSQLAQVFQNLIGNAIKFRGDEAPRVHVGAERSDGVWMISVSDNGIGMDPQYAERIFGVFQRLHTRRDYPGTGIGLALCKKIVERHGGKIWVESKKSGGSTFYFTMPAGAGR